MLVALQVRQRLLPAQFFVLQTWLHETQHKYSLTFTYGCSSAAGVVILLKMLALCDGATLLLKDKHISLENMLLEAGAALTGMATL
jgi:hypothetical protein